jgi:Leucine-rich repeat (LRR) protein
MPPDGRGVLMRSQSSIRSNIMPDPSIPAEPGFHVPFIKSRLPDWTRHLVTPHLQAMTQARNPARRFIKAYPELYAKAPQALRQALLDSQAQSNASNQALATTLKDFKGITEFAKPLLTDALQKKFGQAPDIVNTALFHMRSPNLAEEQPLLQAALRNFEQDDSFDGVALQETSALAPAGALERHYYDHSKHYPFAKVRYSIRDKLSIKPAEFASLCRELDVGKQYQDHLSAVFDAPDKAATVRQQTITANKNRMRVQAHIARIRSDIDAADYATVLAILDGDSPGRLDAEPIIYSRLEVLGSALNDVLIIGAASRRHRHTLQNPWLSALAGSPALGNLIPDSRIIVYIPGDPISPLKAYACAREFAQDLAIKLRTAGYQRFFAGFVAQDESGRFVHRLKRQLKVHKWDPAPVYPGPPYNPDAFRNGMYVEVWNENLDLGMDEVFIDEEVFGACYEFHLARVKSNARLLAVPTAEVDHAAWNTRLKHFAEWGLTVLNVAAFFVPGLGEVMLAVTALQLSYEVYQGAQAWKEGDAEEAWEHFKSVVQNVAFMAVLGAAASKAPPIVNSRFVNGMSRISTPFGEPRLWSPDLAPYKSSVSLEGLEPNAMGQYKVGDKTYIRHEGNVYEKTFDPALKKWRIQHPSDPQAYQPILQHNQLGAWRHTLERPLEWDRPTLLRRMGPSMEDFSDAQLQQIAEASGVSDDALRQMHIDQQPPPPLLAETIRAFKADQQASQLIDRIRTGNNLGSAYEAVVPLAVELPDWPVDEVVEVFEGLEPWGASQRFGSAAALNSVKPTIKITRAQVRAGKLPETVLQALDEPQINRLLGARSAQKGADRVQMFRDSLADHGLGRKKSLFDRLLAGQQTPDADIQRLQRSFPSLSPEGARHVLNNASAAELAQLRSAKIPLRQAQEIRVHLQQGALNRAICGLHLESMASVASDRLALHSLEQLAGWPADVRVELRSGTIKGPLLDSIGSESAPIRNYLVKGDGYFRACDDQGRPVNNIPAHGQNLYESLLEFLPEATRATLEGNQGQALQKKLANHASTHRSDMALILRQRPLNGPGPALRLPDGRLGYLASGRGVGLPDGALISRVRDLYPNISDVQASQFVRSRLSAGDTDQQVFNLLNNRQREFDALDTALNNWVDAGAPVAAGGQSRRVIADRLIHCWRYGLYRELEPSFSLDLRGADPLPEWDAVFNHVRSVELDSGQLIGDSGGELLQRFTKIKKLGLSVNVQDMATLAEKLPELTDITELALDCAVEAYSPQLVQALQGMTQLEQLSLRGNLGVMDFGTLTNLRSLRLVGNLDEWPSGLSGLNRLETVDLQGVPIKSLPDELFSGQESLWRSLQVDWAALEPQAFMKAYDFVHDNPAHLVDEAQMVARYCRGRLSKLLPNDYSFASDAMAQFSKDGLSGRALLAQVDALHEQQQALNQSLDTWEARVVRVDGRQVEVEERAVIAGRIRECARKALRSRYCPPEPVAGPSWRQTDAVDEVLDLTGFGPLGDLPVLGDSVFPHVRSLILRDSGLSTAQVNDFLSGFPQLRTLNLSANQLTALPQAIDTLAELSELNLSFNRISITASGQARLNRLSQLKTLNLAYNRVGALEVGSMTSLQSLDLSHTNIRQWPEGVLSLPNLHRLALNHSGITDIPAAALTGHDQLLAGTSLQGCRLSPPALTAVRTYAQRTVSGNPMGIAQAHLSAGRTGGDPEFFPDEVAERPDLLLPLHLEPGAGDLPQTSAARLQRLDPQLGDAQAVGRIDAWLAQGMTALEIEARLIQWQQQQTQLIKDLNDWIDVPAVRARQGWVGAVDRRRAADQLLECWRATLRDVPAAEGAPTDAALVFTGLIGDLPALSVTFEHVGALDLNGVGLTDSTNTFLRSFPRLRSLTLDNNRLGALPEAVGQCEYLVRLSASSNDLRTSDVLMRQLRSLRHLQWLDLSWNRLGSFDVADLEQLQGLDLRSNNLREWPQGVLQAPALTTLNLSRNQIAIIPPDAFLPEHATLMAGTDLSDNVNLEMEEVLRLQEYQRETGRGLGYTAQEIEQFLEGFGPEASEGGETTDEEVHPDNETPQVQKARWFANVAADSEKHQMWDAVMERDTTHDFSYILSQLEYTRDFAADRLDLTQRVWRVLEAAYGDEALSERLMGTSRALRNRATCGDGRILLFNELEIEVYEFNALKDIAPEHKGRELLKLSRSLFRLSQVEEIAATRIRLMPSLDPAEVRLAYRIGLARRLELPNQPKGMLYEGLAKVTAADLDEAYTRIIAGEKTPEFIEQLTARKYWRDYLEEKYPAEFTRVQQGFQDKVSELEDKYPELNSAYLQEMDALDSVNKANRLQLLTTLSEREIAELGAQA